MKLLTFILIVAFIALMAKHSERKNKERKERSTNLSTQKSITYTSPSGQTWRLFKQILAQPHVLVAGCQGSGKSVAINGMINTLLYRLPFDQDGGAQMILIDPKRVELSAYAKLPHTIAHASGFNPTAWVSALNRATTIMDSRYSYMERSRLKTYDKGDLYVIIDEWANVFKNGGQDAYRAVMRLTSEGRAAKVHVILATQVPTAKVIPSEIRENFDARLCLRTANAVQSRVIMGENGCEDLPRPADAGYAHGFYCHGGISEKYEIPYVKQDELDRNVTWWQDQMRQNGIEKVVS